LPEHFRIKVTTIEESKDVEEMKIEELVGSLQTYEMSCPKSKAEDHFPESFQEKGRSFI
jgi:hypothetical protein